MLFWGLKMLKFFEKITIFFTLLFCVVAGSRTRDGKKIRIHRNTGLDNSVRNKAFNNQELTLKMQLLSQIIRPTVA